MSLSRRAVGSMVALATAVATAAAVPLLSPASALSGTPAFATYAAPASLPNADNAGEPSIGVNRSTGALMYQSYASTYKVTFNDATTPATATWSNVTPSTSVFNIDPILATDAGTGRTFAGGLAGECSALSYSDNDGASWTQMGNACTGALDHETIGSGPWAGAAPLGATYSRAVYYCAQNGVDACATSTNGGLTFGAPVTVSGACGGLHGHVKVSANGTAYVPNNNCGNVGGFKTTSNGSSWSSYTIAGQPSAARGFDPSVATTPDNTLYEAWARAGDYHPMVGRSTNAGGSWDRVTDLASTVSPPIVASTFQATVAGDNGRVAVAFLGTQTGSGVPFDNGYHGVWNLYVSYSYDGGLTWTTVKASDDPVQRGCIWDGGGSNACRNMLDFMDANLSKDGRVVVGYADGCIGACAGASGTEAQSTSAYATIARQSVGKGLLAAFDTAPSPTPSATATATATPTPTPTATATPTPTATGTTDPDPATPTLTDGVAKSGSSAATSGSWQYYKIAVPAGKSKLTVNLTTSQSCGLLGCSPDLDLYVRKAAKPTTSLYDGTAQTSSSTETVTITSPAADWWYVGVYVYSGSSSLAYNIKATTS